MLPGSTGRILIVENNMFDARATQEVRHRQSGLTTADHHHRNPLCPVHGLRLAGWAAGLSAFSATPVWRGPPMVVAL